MGDPIDEYRKHLYDAYHAASRDYDQAILTVAGGTLGLSVTFLHNITPTPVVGSLPILAAAWVALGVAVATMVTSFVTSQRAIRDAIIALDVDRATSAPTRKGIASMVTVGLNIIAGIALGVGLALLGIYAIVNIGG